MSRLAVLPCVFLLACGGARTVNDPDPNADVDIRSETRTDTPAPNGSTRAFTALTPPDGTLRGGTEVTLTGAGFVSTMFATFGGKNCNGLNVISETQARCR